jgi:hypothetical protein
MLQDLDRLPLLDAIIKETMRLRSPTPGPQRRVVPSGGVTVNGYFVPADTIIGTSQRAVHRNEEVFPEPDVWKPERWMKDALNKELGDKDPSKWWWAFGSGAMSCSGKDFALIGRFIIDLIYSAAASVLRLHGRFLFFWTDAWQVMKLILATIYSNFETTIIDDTGIEQTDTFMATPEGGQLTLGFMIS